MLKNLLRQAADALAERNMGEREVETFLAPAAQLVEDYDFWQYQDLGLAIFLSDAGIEMHKLPIPVPELAIIGPGFHIAPLLPLQEQDAVFVILTMTAEAARVWQATRFGLTAVDVAELPRSIESLDEAPDHEGSLQSHGFGRPNTGGENMPKTQAYGDSPEEWRKGRLVEFALRAGTALAAHLAGDPKPVVVVADAAIGGHVRNNVALAPLVAGFVEINPATLDEAGLLATASVVMQPLHDKALGIALGHLDALLGRGDATACINPAHIITAARDGRVDQLFIARDVVLRGTLDPETGAAPVTDGAKAGSLDLLDKAAQMVLGSGGVVWMVAADRLQEGTAMAAILRYLAPSQSDPGGALHSNSS
ncbi:baeRF3 domain-containing protein [Rhabdonatronobacter sediminivivens]|nr:hypothetical protein [Rhabdonatronobacter sediminivivens]